MYINLINDLVKDESNSDETSIKKFKHIITSIEHENIYKIVFNRPNKLNAINIQVILYIFNFLNLYFFIKKKHYKIIIND